MSEVAVYLVVATYDYEGDAILSAHPDRESAITARDAVRRSQRRSSGVWVDAYAIPPSWSEDERAFTDLAVDDAPTS